jgi:hypothetical protein
MLVQPEEHPEQYQHDEDDVQDNFNNSHLILLELPANRASTSFSLKAW